MYCDIRRSWSLQLVKWKLVDQYYMLLFYKWTRVPHKFCTENLSLLNYGWIAWYDYCCSNCCLCYMHAAHATKIGQNIHDLTVFWLQMSWGILNTFFLWCAHLSRLFIGNIHIIHTITSKFCPTTITRFHHKLNQLQKFRR